MKKTQLSLIFTVTIVVLAFLSVGCDEGMQMTKPIMDMDPAEKPTTNGETKQPDSGKQNPGGQDPEKPETPTLTIDTMTRADDGSVTISGTSANLPAETKVTIVLGDDAITMKAAVDKDGTWSVIVPTKKLMQLTVGTITVKAITGKAEAASSFEHAPPPEPTITIETINNEEDGSVTVSGTSTELTAGETVTITIGDALTITATTDNEGAWSATVPAIETTGLAAGTTAVTAAAKKATADNSFEYTPPQPEQPENGTLIPAETERIQYEIITEVIGDDDKHFEFKSNYIIEKYGSLFNMGTEVGRDAFKRFAEYEEKAWVLYTYSPSVPFPPKEERIKLLDQWFEEAYGISADYARWLVYEVYLKEKPEDEKYIGVGWQKDNISMEHLLLRIDNPNATEEEILELLRESIRAGNVSIAA